MKPYRLAFHFGQGIFAGLAGTAAITASQTVEMFMTGRKPSESPAQAAQKVLGIQARDEKAEARLVQLVHWAYGTSWGLFRALLGAVGVRGAPATVLHWAAIQQSADTLLPALEIAPPIAEWDRKQLAVELGHHFVYALAAGAAFDALENSPKGFFRSCVKMIPSALLGALFASFLAPFFLLQAGKKKAPAGKPESETAARRAREEVAAHAG